MWKVSLWRLFNTIKLPVEGAGISCKPLDAPCLLALQDLESEESVCTSRARCQRSPVTSAVFPQHPLLTNLNIMPLGKGKTFKGPRSIFIEHAKRLNSKLRSNKPVTSKETCFFNPKETRIRYYLFIYTNEEIDLSSERLNDLFRSIQLKNGRSTFQTQVCSFLRPCAFHQPLRNTNNDSPLQKLTIALNTLVEILYQESLFSSFILFPSGPTDKGSYVDITTYSVVTIDSQILRLKGIGRTYFSGVSEASFQPYLSCARVSLSSGSIPV